MYSWETCCEELEKLPSCHWEFPIWMTSPEKRTPLFIWVSHHLRFCCLSLFSCILILFTCIYYSSVFLTFLWPCTQLSLGVSSLPKILNSSEGRCTPPSWPNLKLLNTYLLFSAPFASLHPYSRNLGTYVWLHAWVLPFQDLCGHWICGFRYGITKSHF